jgi:hypothetical protein
MTTPLADEILWKLQEPAKREEFNRNYALEKKLEKKRLQMKSFDRKLASGVWGIDQRVSIRYNFARRPQRPCYFCRSISVYESEGWFAPPRCEGGRGALGYGYRPHFACFNCRRGWKGFLPITAEVTSDDEDNQNYGVFVDGSKCGICVKQGTYMGSKFCAPKPKDKKAWMRVQQMFAEDPSVFEAKCKCTSDMPMSPVRSHY